MISSVPVRMLANISNTQLKSFLKQIFCGVARNSPYEIGHFLEILLDAAEKNDFVNNASIRLCGPTGETLFSRLKNTSFKDIKSAFYNVLTQVLPYLKGLIRNRDIALAFDTTDEPFYGKVTGLWIHPQKPAKGSTGCYKYITVSCTDRNMKLILGSLPVPVGYDVVALVLELLDKILKYVNPNIALFDRGFDNCQLIEALQNLGLRYQILWRKIKWTTKMFKEMKRGEIKETTRTSIYSKNKSKYKVKIRFVLIKKYARTKKCKAYDWVFATNTRQKSQHYYIDKYRKRWNIETAFRVLDNIQIKTTTKNEVVRFFLNMFCCLVYNLWKIVNITQSKISLKNFVNLILTELIHKIGEKCLPE